MGSAPQMRNLTVRLLKIVDNYDNTKDKKEPRMKPDGLSSKHLLPDFAETALLRKWRVVDFQVLSALLRLLWQFLF